MPTRMHVNREKLEKLRRAFGAEGIAAVLWDSGMQFSPILWRRLAEITPEGKTGAMRQRWKVVPIRAHPGVSVTNSAPHAFWVDRGTRPHTIVPRRKKILAWRSGGRGQASSFQPRSGGTGGNLSRTYKELRAEGSSVVPDVFARVVRHPGTKRQDIVELGWRDKASTFLETIHQMMDRALSRIAR